MVVGYQLFKVNEFIIIIIIIIIIYFFFLGGGGGRTIERCTNQFSRCVETIYCQNLADPTSGENIFVKGAWFILLNANYESVILKWKESVPVYFLTS